MGGTGDELEMYWTGRGHAVGSWQQVLIQVRTGEMTLDALAHIETAGRLHRARSQGKIGALFVVSPNAGPAPWETAKRQRALLSSLEADPRIYACAVVEGDGLGAMAQRAVLRTIFRSNRRITCADVMTGAKWICGVLGAGLPNELENAVEKLRRRCEFSRAP